MLVEILEFPKRRKKRHSRHVVHSDSPDPSSFASALLLRQQFQNSDKKIIRLINDNWKARLRFRDAFVKKEQKKGPLTCHYCGKNKLAFNEPIYRKYRKKYNDIATIDHVIPQSQGANYYDESNLVIACGKCNRNKGSMNVKNFKTKYLTA